jgi:quinol monooxygenase YgiN
MPLVIVARLRVRGPEHMPIFGMHALGSVEQVKHAEGCLGAAFLEDANLTFWNATVWRDETAMRLFRNTAAHASAMLHLAELCDEATMLRWQQASSDLPSWLEAHARLKFEGRASKVLHPSTAHVSLEFPLPRIGA